MKAQLLAIVEVDEDKKVRCDACGHGIYRSVHVIRDAVKWWVLGSTCSALLFEKTLASPTPRFGGSKGRKLTDEEREWLISNTVELIERFRIEEAAAAEAARVAKYDENRARIAPEQERGALRDRPARHEHVFEELEEGDRQWTPSV